MRARPLWILLALCACGRAEVYPHPTKPVVPLTRPDGGAQDSGMPPSDGGAPDAGPPADGGTCPPVGAACPFSEPPMSFSCVPGLKLLSKGVDTQGRFLYQLTYRQPLDHDDPNGPSFEQRLSLHHVSATSPMVLLATGYELYETYDELDAMFFVNEISVEHRYFGDSATDAGDLRYLDIRQASNDLHRIRTAFAGLYPKNWVSTGASKGGMTMVYYRRFFPCDVVGTVPFVAPHSGREADPRYNAFLAGVGGPARADCRARLENLQRQLLQRRDVLTPTLPHPDSGYGIIGGIDAALEVSVLGFGFAFWQYVSPDDPNFGCNTLPSGPLSDAELTTWAQQLVGGDDESNRAYAAYYYQAATQLGDPASYATPFAGLIRYPGKDSARALIDPAITVPAFDPAPMQDVQRWLTTEGAGFVFVYGELDPWTAGQFDLGQATDALKAIAPGKNHYAELADLSPTDKQAALVKLERWLGQKSSGHLRAPARVRPPPHKGPPVPWLH